MQFLIMCSTQLQAGSAVFENFKNGIGGFTENKFLSVTNEQLLFSGDGNKGGDIIPWMGGSKSGKFNPSPQNSNYFENFIVSSDMIWKGGDQNATYGLSTCIQQNSEGKLDYLSFFIAGTGNDTAYKISMTKNNQYKILVDWTKSSTIKSGSINTLSIHKINNNFSFEINDKKVEQLSINGCSDGAIGVGVSTEGVFAFDNFNIKPIIIEDFNIDAGGFSGSKYFVPSNGKLIFQGDGSDGTRLTAWNGGYNASGFSPKIEHSNYFSDFVFSIDTLWMGGDDNYNYGVYVCAREDSDKLKGIGFYIVGSGSYLITVDGNKFGDWTQSNSIKVGQINTLQIVKINNNLLFVINNQTVKELDLTNSCGGSIAFESANVVNVSYDNFLLIDYTLQPYTPPIPDVQPEENKPPIAKFTVTPSSGNAPLTVSLDASASSDPDGSISSYNWSSSDGQTATGVTASMIFNNAGSYNITLTVKDNGGKTNTVTQTVTVNPTPTPTSCNENLCLNFIGLKNFYAVGDIVKLDLAQKVDRDRFSRVDLWLAIEMPNNGILYKTDKAFLPFSGEAQAFKTSIERMDITDNILNIEIPPGIGGTYQFHAVYVKAGGKNPVKNGLDIIKKINKTVTLAK